MMRQRQPLQIIARQGGRKHVALAWRGGADRASAAAAGRMAPARHVAHGAAAQLCAQLVLRLAPFNTITAASPSSPPSSPYSLMEPPLYSPAASSSPRDIVFSFGAQMAAAASANASRGSGPVRSSSSSEHDSAAAGASAAAAPGGPAAAAVTAASTSSGGTVEGGHAASSPSESGDGGDGGGGSSGGGSGGGGDPPKATGPQDNPDDEGHHSKLHYGSMSFLQVGIIGRPL